MPRRPGAPWTASTRKSGLPSESANRRAACASSSGAPSIRSASTPVSARLSRPSSISEKRSSACSPAASSPTGSPASSSSRRAVAATSSGAGGLRAQEVVQELERRDVEPLQVVGDEQQRRARRRAAPGRPPRTGAGAARARAAAPAAGGPGAPLELGEQARELGQMRALEPAQPRADGIGAQPGDDRPVGDRALGRVRARLGCRRARVGAPRPQLLDQPALPDPRLAA